jgi:predicted nucleic acid-binding protein
VILLDTNVILEIMRSDGETNARRWLDAQPTRSIYISAPVLAELRFGVELLEPGVRRARLEQAYERIATDLFVGRILVFDRTAADHFGKLRAKRRRAGKAIGAMDALIAAIALANSMILATRNTGDFERLELPLVNPFAVHAD